MYAFRCGYCGVSDAQVGSELTYDHFRPQSQNGSDHAAKIVYACHDCNEFKGDYWSDGNDTRLLHPLTDFMSLHISEEADGTVKSITTLGDIYISQLQLNRPALVATRLEKQSVRRIEDHLAQISLTLSDILSKIKKQSVG